MPSGIHPRKIAGYEFFNDCPEACDPFGTGGFEALGVGDQEAAGLFIASLSGCRKVLDVGCGVGFPALCLSRYVDQVVGVDAAPNMVSAARADSERLGVTNASFETAGADGLPFGNEEFDGASLCGVLESMDWEAVHRMLPEIWRVLAPRGRIALLDRDWQALLRTNPLKEGHTRSDRGRLLLQFVERTPSPPLERDTRYLVRADSPLARRLRTELGENARVPTMMAREDVAGGDALDAWYDEAAQFDAETVEELIASNDFREIAVRSLAVWRERILFLTATKPTQNSRTACQKRASEEHQIPA